MDYSGDIAYRNELLAFWSSVLRDENESRVQRLKASEFLAKAYGMFSIERETEGSIYQHIADCPAYGNLNLPELKAIEPFWKNVVVAADELIEEYKAQNQIEKVLELEYKKPEYLERLQEIQKLISMRLNDLKDD